MKHCFTRGLSLLLLIVLLCNCSTGESHPATEEVTAAGEGKAETVLTEITDTETADLSGTFDAFRGLVPTTDGAIVALGMKDARPQIVFLDGEGGVTDAFTPDAPADLTVMIPDIGDTFDLARICENRDGGFTLYFPSRLQVYDSAGTLTETIPFAGLEGQEGMFKGPFHLGGKRYVFWGNRKLALLEEDGTLTVKDTPGHKEVLSFFYADDALYACTSSFGSKSALLETVDPQTLAFEEERKVPDLLQPLHIRYCAAAAGFFVNDGTAVYSFSGEAEHAEKEFDLTEASVSGSIGHILQTEPHVFLCTSQNDTTLYRVRAHAGQRERQVITVADVHFLKGWQLPVYVAKFNAENTEYYARIVPYDYENRQLLQADLAAGNAPDVFLMNETDLPLSEELFVDLLPYIDADPELSREDLMQHVLERSLINGQMLCAFDSFSFTMLTGRVSVIGDADSWTMEDVRRILEERPDLYSSPSFMTAENLLGLSCDFCLSQYVDVDTMTCDFETESFYEYLAFCKLIGERRAPEDSFIHQWDEKCLFAYGGWWTPEILAHVFRNNYGGDAVNRIGFPNEEGVSGNSISPSTEGLMFSIPQSTKDKDAAFRFVRFLYSRSWQEGIKEVSPWGDIFYYIDGFPMRRSAVDARFEKLLTNEEYSFDQAEIDRTMAFIEGIDHFAWPNNDLYNIITEEAMYYFEGAKTAEEVASVIQSRASLYLAERR